MPLDVQRELARLTGKDDRLTEISFSGLATSHADVLGSALGMGVHLRRVVLEECHLGVESAQCWAEQLSALKSLEVLNLGHNQLEIRGLEVFLAALTSVGLRELVLTDNLLGPKAAQMVGELMLQLPSLVGVNLSENFLQEEGAALLAEVLCKGSTSGLSLDLSSNDLRVAGAKSLARLMELDHFRSLELASNRLHDFGIKALAQPLRQNRGLTFLGLAENKISDEGLQVLAEALGENQTLEILELDYNSITDEGALCTKPLRCQVTLAGNRASFPGIHHCSTAGYR